MKSLAHQIVSILPRSLAESMERKSREWILSCPCGYSVSIWEMGGIRWKASGNPRRLHRCPECHETHWMTLTRQNPSPSSA